MIPSPHDGMHDAGKAEVAAIPSSLWAELAAAARRNDVMIHITITPYERDIEINLNEGTGPSDSIEQ